jgi:DnaJ-class molecular chaperone
MSDNNYYQALNVQPDADAHEIKASYRKLAFKYHPDRNKGNPGAADRMKSINEAYAVLSDPDKRRQYDNLYQRFGDGAKGHFRQTYSEAEIFKGSDIQQIYEEMARAFGLRGFDAIFKDFYGQGYRSFEFRQPGMFGKGFIFNSAGRGGGPGMMRQRLAGSIAQKMLSKLTGILLPQRGGDLHGVIVLHPEFAIQGGPYAYYHRARNKKLVVQIPNGVHDGQKIRLTGMGKEGTHGGDPGDLLLKVKIKTPLLKKLKSLIGVDAPRR